MRRPIVVYATAVVVLTGASFVAGIESASNPKDKSPTTLVVPVDGLDKGIAPDSSIKVPAKAVQQAAPTIEDQLNAPPAATPPAQLQDAQKAADEIRKTQTPLLTAGATSGIKGCRTSFVRNQSSRRGVRPQWQVLHYTVSPNRPGWSDVDAVVALFDRTSSQASSHFVIDSEGHCAYIVPIEAKSWTEAAANSFSVGYEIIAMGSESTYLAPAGLAKLRYVIHEVARRTGIPLRRGSNNGCSPGRSGLMQHADFGICGGGHVDVRPFKAESIISSLVSGSSAKPVTMTDISTCSKINFWRSHGRQHGAPQHNAVRRKAALTKRHVVCTSHGPVRH